MKKPAAVSFTALGRHRISDKHTVIVSTADDAAPLEVGDKLRLVPGHCDPTVNLHDWLVAVRAGVVEQVWPVAARGRCFRHRP